MATALRSEAEVQRLVRENEKLVDYMVNRYLKRYFVGSMEREDLVSWGMIGLVQAARAWDPERGHSFSTLACRAIERALVRGVRREWRPDEARATVSLDAAIFDEGSDGGEERFIELLRARDDVEDRIVAFETGSAVRAAMAALPPEHREVIRRHYFNDEPVRDIARDLGLTRQAVYLREKMALRQLRAALGEGTMEMPMAA
jgi:RNA polymerase sigma factor for flagellar operon FliA